MGLIDGRIVQGSNGKDILSNLGNPDNLATTKKGSLVEAVNDLYGIVKDNADAISSSSGNVDKVAKKMDWIDVRDFGAKGDGVTDDTAALQAAIDSVQGSSVVLRLTPSASYKITDTLKVTKTLSIQGNKQNRPRIYSTSQNFTGMTVSGSFNGSTKLSASATVNTNYIDVADASNIRRSNLIEIISSQSWYHDARQESTDARKAELHRVAEVVGKRVYLTDALFDGYVVPAETVTVNSYTPIRFAMCDVDITLTKYPGNTDSIRKTGIVLDHTIDSILENVCVTDAQNKGISIEHSYRPLVEGGRTEGSNNYYSGYGVQIVGCTHGKVRNRYSVGNRRGVDVSGYTIPSHMTIVEGCTVYGSGSNSMGERYIYNDDHTRGAYAGGVGTHGPADHTILRNNILGYLHTGVIDRSRNTIIEGNYFVGEFAKPCVDVSFGENSTIINNYTYDGFTGRKNQTISGGGANINTRKPPAFIRIQDTALANGSSGFFRIENNFAMVQDTFLEMYGETGGNAIPTVRDLIVKNNHCYFSPQSGSDTASFIKNATVVNSTILISGSVVKDNTWKRLNGSGNILEYNKVDPRQGSEIEGIKSYSMFLATDTVGSILLGNSNTLYARVIVDAGSSSGGASGMLRVGQGNSSTNEFGQLTNVATVSSIPTGTTGATNKINLALRDGVLYVENRIGSTQRIVITVLAVI